MASNQEQVNGEDFSQDVSTNEEEHVNGSTEQQGAAGEKQNGDSNGSAAEAPGRDDDRYEFVHIQITPNQIQKRKKRKLKRKIKPQRELFYFK